MKYKSKLKWLISGLVLLSAASISSVAVACTPKNSSPTKPSKPNDTKKSNPQNSLSKPSDNKVSTPSKPKPTNPLSSQPKENPSNTKKDSVDKTTKPSDPTNNQKDKDRTGNSKTDKDQKEQTPKTPETKKEDKDDSSKQMDGTDKQKSDTPNIMDGQNKPDNSNSSGSISNPKQPEIQNKPKESEKMEDVAPTEPAPKKDESKTGDDKSKQNDSESDSMGSKPKAEQAPKTKQDPPTDINNKIDKDQKDEKQSEGQNQPPAKQQQQQQQQNGMGGQDLKPKGVDPHPNQDGSGNNNSSIEENIDKTRPLLRFKDNQPQIGLYPSSNEGLLSLVFDKQDYTDELKDKVIVVILKNVNGSDSAHAAIQNIDKNNTFDFVFKPIVESGQYKLESAFIFKNDGNNKPDDKSKVNVVLTESDKNKTIAVKKPESKKEIPDTEKNKKAAIITLAESDNKLELSVKSKETGPTIDGKYLKVVLLGLEKDREQYATPYHNISKNLLISNGKVMIPGFEINDQIKKTYSKIIVKVLGIYDKEDGSEKSEMFRFDYGGDNTLIDPNDNLILIKTLN